MSIDFYLEKQLANSVKKTKRCDKSCIRKMMPQDKKSCTRASFNKEMNWLVAQSGYSDQNTAEYQYKTY